MTAPPREPTQEMVNAGREELTGPRADDKAPMRRAWIAMYDAAPAPSAECCRGLAPISECRKECGGNAPPAAQPAEPSATDDLVRKLLDGCPADDISDNGCENERIMAGIRLQRQAREIAELRAECVLRQIQGYNEGKEAASARLYEAEAEQLTRDMRQRAERAERELALHHHEEWAKKLAEVEAERDALRADAERAGKLLMDAPGLPLEILAESDLAKWTDAIAGLLIIFADAIDAARAKVKP